MRRSALIGGVIAAFVILASAIFGTAQSGNVLGFNCLGALTMPYECASSTAVGLRGNNASGTNAVVAGANMPSDGGGGDFVDIGNASAACGSFPITDNITGNGTVGSAKIISVSLTRTQFNTLTVGEAVSGSGTNIQIPPGAEIAAIDKANSHLILTLPLIGTATTSQPVSIAISGDNGGTLIIDHESNPQCWQKTNYRGDPHEFAAFGDGQTDDTIPMENWLGAYGNVNPTLAPATAPSNFGPWILTIPANYLVSEPLVCPPAGDIESRANPSGEAANAAPVVRITANSFPAFTNPQYEPALMVAGNYCRLSGIALDATNIGSFYLATTGTPTNGQPTLTGVPNISGIEPGMPIFDSAGDIPTGTYVQSASGTTITMTQNAICTTCTTNDNIYITGLDTVEDSGSRIAIDDHALLEGGYANVRCGGPSNFNAGLEIKDAQIIKGWDEGVHLGGCTNIRLIADLISANGIGAMGMPTTEIPDGYGVSFHGQDLTISDGVIEESAGAGLFLSKSNLTSVTGMYFDNNGRYLGGPAIAIQNASYATICSNHIHRSGGELFYPNTNTPEITAQIYFSGTSDSINLCGNIYYADNNPNEATLVPTYVYDAAPLSGNTPQTVLTNTQLYERPGLQAAGQVFSPNAAPLLAPLQAPQYSNEITGLTLSNDTGNAETVDIAAGTAADSTGTSLIQLPPNGSSPACTVNLGASGAGGLDNGSVAPGTTYNYFVIASAGGSNGGPPSTSCVASSNFRPKFTANNMAPYTTTQKATFIPSTNLLYVPSVAGINVGDPVQPLSGVIPASTTVSSIGTTTLYAIATSVTPGTTSTIVSLPPGTISQLVLGMTVSDNPNNQIANAACSHNPNGLGYFGSSSVITAISTTYNQITITGGSNSFASGDTDCFTISGGSAITLSNSTISTTTSPQNITFETGLYRMVGALNTGTGSTPPVVPFTQNGDTFYLATPALFSASINGSIALPIPSVPQGIAVEAFGRCVATNPSNGNFVIIYPRSTSPGTPTTFPTVPGYAFQTTQTSNPQATTSYPYRIYTDTMGDIGAQATASAASSSLNCMNDGWVWKRAQ